MKKLCFDFSVWVCRNFFIGGCVVLRMVIMLFMFIWLFRLKLCLCRLLIMFMLIGVMMNIVRISVMLLSMMLGGIC